MYNNIGLATARGSGTNGYVQRNLSFIKKTKEKIVYKPVPREVLEKRIVKKANEELLLHDNKRKLELKCVEMKELMTDQGFAEDEIEEKVSLFRKMLLESLESKKISQQTNFEEDELGRPITKGTHQFSEAAKRKNEVIKNAFGIDDDYQPGSIFSKMTKKSENDTKKLTKDDEKPSGHIEMVMEPVPLITPKTIDIPKAIEGSKQTPDEIFPPFLKTLIKQKKADKKKSKKSKKEKSKDRVITYSENVEAVREGKKSKKHKRQQSESSSSEESDFSSEESTDDSESTVDSEFERELALKRLKKQEREQKRQIKKDLHKQDKKVRSRDRLSSSSITSLPPEQKKFETVQIASDNDSNDQSSKRKKLKTKEFKDGKEKSCHKHDRERQHKLNNKKDIIENGHKPRAEHYFDIDEDRIKKDKNGNKNHHGSKSHKHKERKHHH